MKKWYESLEKDQEFHALSTGAGLENMMKEPPKDETLLRYCQPIVNPEDGSTFNGKDGALGGGNCMGNTVEDENEMKGEDDEEDIAAGDRSISPNEIRKKLFEERRKRFARKWFTKYNYFQKMKE